MKQVFSAIVAALLALAPAHAFAKKDEIYQSGSLFGDKYAVGGYDAVAYFTEGQPIEGSDEFTTEYKNAKWRFASQANLDAFLANPEAYAPQYGGYCAWAVANGQTASGDPQLWKIVDDKLYLNYNEKVKADWEKDIPGFIAKADDNWPTVLE